MNEIRPREGGPEPQSSAGAETAARGVHSARGGIVSRLLSRRALVRTLALAAVAAVIAGAYILGSPAGSPVTFSAQRLTATSQEYSGNGAVPFAAATAAPAPAAGAVDKTANQNPAVEPGQPDQLLAALDSALIVKTGQLSLEVTDLDKAVTEAQSAIAGLGGSVSSSNRSGTGDYAAASVTYRVPAGRWDDALGVLRKIGSTTLAEQTDTSDVSSQVVDLQARLDNLKTTESALQAIMAKAVAIPDVIAVESQLSQTQGQIEQLTAQRDHLKDQAAMSTLTVTFQLPSKTVTSQATQDWTLGSQVDEAAAALVRIGQGLATMGVWALVVVLPIGFGLLILLALFTLARRILGRGRNRSAATPA
ncbi:MAG TPA: DUF4349 domain-containing protein [Candidatus Limnocylindrales bacterium]|jgi:hypothetical protein|nr:DUF4349 domain-containing protein [Candidatus Limnocylindrales bacterium]